MRGGRAGNNQLLGGLHTLHRGDFKPSKCHVSVHAQVPDGQGGYEYLSTVRRAAREAVGADNELEQEGIGFVVPQADGTTAAIKTLLADESKRYLGMWGRPDGSPVDHLADMREKIEE